MKILCMRTPSQPPRRTGGGPLKKPTVLREASKIRKVFEFRRTSWRREFVTASANSIGGAVTRLNALIPSILPGPVIYLAG